MRKVLLTTAAMAILAGSQMGFAACTTSGNPAESASCDSKVTLQVKKLVVLKGLDNYDFSDPGSKGWDGTADTNAVQPGSFCVGTNDSNSGVSVTFTSSNGGFQVQGFDSTDTVAYSVIANNAAINDGDAIDMTSSTLQNLGCGTDNFNMDVQFAGADLLLATVDQIYSDTITVTVAPN
jgi:hypothetical protein